MTSGITIIGYWYLLGVAHALLFFLSCVASQCGGWRKGLRQQNTMKKLECCPIHKVWRPGKSGLVFHTGVVRNCRTVAVHFVGQVVPKTTQDYLSQVWEFSSSFFFSFFSFFILELRSTNLSSCVASQQCLHSVDWSTVKLLSVFCKTKQEGVSIVVQKWNKTKNNLTQQMLSCASPPWPHCWVSPPLCF